MSALHVTIEQLTAERLEGRCTQWSDFPKPGYFIDFLTNQGTHFYTQIESVSPVPEAPNVLHLSLLPISGSPDSRVKEASQISQMDFYKNQQGYQDMDVPIALHDIQFDLNKSGKVVYVKPNELGLHQRIVKSFKDAGFPVVIIDPIGMSWGEEEAKQYLLGKDTQLSVQEVGINYFIEWVIESLPKAIQPKASEFLLSLVPPTPDFIPIQYFVSHPLLKDHPLSAAILHQLYVFHKNQLFASLPEKALTFEKIEGCLHLNLSALPPALLPLAYEGILRMAFRQVLPVNTQIVLIAPEVHPDFVSEFIQRIHHRIFLVSNISKTWKEFVVDSWGEARLFGEEGIEVQGEITDDLKLFLPYRNIENLAATLSNPTEPTAIETAEDAVQAASENIDGLEAASPDFEEGSQREMTTDVLPAVEPNEPELVDLESIIDEDLLTSTEEQNAALETVSIEAEAGVADDLESLHQLLGSAPENQEEALEGADSPEANAEPSVLDLDYFLNKETDGLEFESEGGDDASDTSLVSEASSEDPNWKGMVIDWKESQEPVNETTHLVATSDDFLMDSSPWLPEGEESLLVSGENLEQNDTNLDGVTAFDTDDSSKTFVGGKSLLDEEIDFLPESSDKLWDFDFSSLSGSNDGDTGFYRLLQKEIPNIAVGIAPIEMLEDAGGLGLDWDMSTLEMEEGLLANMAPDLLETVSEKNLETDEDKLELEAEVEVGTTTVFEEVYVSGEEMEQDNIDYLKDLLETSEKESKAVQENDTIGGLFDEHWVYELEEGGEEIAAMDNTQVHSSQGMAINFHEFVDSAQSAAGSDWELSVVQEAQPQSEQIAEETLAEVAAVNDEGDFVFHLDDDEDTLPSNNLEFIDLPTENDDLLKASQDEEMPIFTLDQGNITETSLPPGLVSSEGDDQASDNTQSMEGEPLLQTPDETVSTDALTLESDEELQFFLLEDEAEEQQSSDSSIDELEARMLDLSNQLGVNDPGFGEKALASQVEALSKMNYVDPALEASLQNEAVSSEEDDDFNWQMGSNTMSEVGEFQFDLPEAQSIEDTEDAELSESLAETTLQENIDFSLQFELPEEQSSIEEPISLDFPESLSETAVDENVAVVPQLELAADMPIEGLDVTKTEMSFEPLEEVESLPSPELEASEPVAESPDLTLPEQEEEANPLETLSLSEASEPLADLEGLDFHFETSLEETEPISLEFGTLESQPDQPQEIAAVNASDAQIFSQHDDALDLLFPSTPEMFDLEGKQEPDEVIPDFNLDPDPQADAQVGSTQQLESALPIYKNLSREDGVIAFRPGEQVFHKRYGQGTIKKVITMDADQVILNINFEGIGKRLLDPNLSQLEKVS